MASAAKICALAVLVSSAAAGQDLTRDAYDILKKNCFECHGAAKISALDLQTREAMLKGGTRGPSIVPGDPDKSLLYQFVTHAQKPPMPPVKKLADEELDTLRRWIEAGAETAGAESGPISDDKRAAELARIESRPIKPEERKFWAFQRPKRVTPPRGAANPVDAFLLAAMKAKGLEPSPRADRRTLIRRAYLDLIGLPPTPAESDAFGSDTSRDAWERLVDKLLASPHYGERWGRHWLDLVRFADSGGFERDFDWLNAWRYRDYVVDSFNQDKPYDKFIREQLAGDEYKPVSNDAMVATGYLRLGLDNNIKNERTRMDELDDLVATTSLTFLGMTVGCARCHNHKFDPIPQKDYYQLQAVFYSTKAVDHPLVDADVLAAHRNETKRISELRSPLQAERTQLEKPYRARLVDAKLATLPEYVQIAWRTPPDKRTEGQKLNARQIEQTLSFNEEQIRAIMSPQDQQKHRELVARIKEIDALRPKPYASARAIGEQDREARPSYFLHRGSPDSKGSRMSPGVLSVAAETEYQYPQPPPDATSSWRRRGLAEWIASPDNPLTARVMVNRIWQHHFGEGIVRTPSNFGKTGQPPSHPELLDWLATEFVSRGWSVKSLHRLMLTSNAYQMASDDRPANLRIDPENRLFWRMPRRRLEAEIVRDQILAVAGSLDRTVGGPAVFPYIDPDLFQSSTSRTWPGKPDDDPSTWRRSIYVFSKRSIRYPLFETFDQPDLMSSCDRRNRSTIAPQALLLMNSSLVILQAKQFAERLRKDVGETVDAQIEHAYRLALGRAPTAFERTKSAEYIQSGPRGLADFCQALFNLNEFVYRQ